MPLIHITTNTKIDDVDSFCKRASLITATALGKPESYIMVKLEQESNLLFAGTSEPAAHIKLKSLGLPEDKTPEYSKTLCSFIENELAIQPSRTYIEFSNPQRHLWGWDNRTF